MYSNKCLARMPQYRNHDNQLVKELIEMQNHYKYAELQFQKFNSIIPYTRNPPNVYSPRLASLILTLGPQVLGTFGIIKQQLGVTCGDTFGKYYEALNSDGMLSSQGFVLENGDVKYPFMKSNPEWWEAYNHSIKHQMPSGMSSAILVNIIDALGALFILHHIADVIQASNQKLVKDILFSANWIQVTTVGHYIFYETPTQRNELPLAGFGSRIFTMDKRFLPHVKGQNARKPSTVWWSDY